MSENVSGYGLDTNHLLAQISNLQYHFPGNQEKSYARVTYDDFILYLIANYYSGIFIPFTKSDRFTVFQQLLDSNQVLMYIK